MRQINAQRQQSVTPAGSKARQDSRARPEERRSAFADG